MVPHFVFCFLLNGIRFAVTLTKQNMKISKRSLGFRKAAFISIVLNIAFNFVYPVTGVATVADVTRNYPALFTPASYAFIIWAVIYIGFFIYGVVQLLRGQRHFPIYDRLSVPVILIQLLLSAWIVFYTRNQIGTSVFILGLALFVSCYAFRKAYLAVQYRDYNLWLQFPFSLLAGWLTVALAANVFIYMHYLGWSINMEEGTLSTMTIVGCGLIGFVVSRYTYSLLYPAVISWGIIAVSVQTQHEHPSLSATALTTSIILLVLTLFTSVFRKIPARKEVSHHLDA